VAALILQWRIQKAERAIKEPFRQSLPQSGARASNAQNNRIR
jgi:hypothetical protein